MIRVPEVDELRRQPAAVRVRIAALTFSSTTGSRNLKAEVPVGKWPRSRAFSCPVANRTHVPGPQPHHNFIEVFGEVAGDNRDGALEGAGRRHCAIRPVI